jgi:hypothetical protein
MIHSGKRHQIASTSFKVIQAAIILQLHYLLQRQVLAQLPYEDEQ